MPKRLARRPVTDVHLTFYSPLAMRSNREQPDSGESVRGGVDDEGHDELESVGGVFRRIFRIIGPFQTIPKIGVPLHEDIDSTLPVHNSEHLWIFTGGAVLPLVAGPA